MSLKTLVKRGLKMCGHAFVVTVHERLDSFERRADSLNNQNVNLAETQAALLQSSIHQVEALSRLEGEMLARTDELRQAAELLARQTAAAEMRLSERISEAEMRLSERISEAEMRLSERISEAEKHQAGLAETQSRAVQEGSEHARKAHGAVGDLHRYTRSMFDQELVRQVCLETDDYAFTNPEAGLMSFLYSYLPSRQAIDVGAHTGDVSEWLLNSGYEVYALEPNPPVYQLLSERLGARASFHSFQLAAGCEEGDRTLHLARDMSEGGIYGNDTVFSSLVPHSMPGDLPFTGAVTVPVKSLASLHASGAVPAGAGLVKIDTEGFDLEVIRGMGDHCYPVVAAEYWDTETPFGKTGLLYTLDSLAAEMASRGYLWHIVLYRIWGRNHTAFYCNHGRAVPNSWGNAFFFRDYPLFAQAQSWCSAALPRTYFKPAAGRRAKAKQP